MTTKDTILDIELKSEAMSVLISVEKCVISRFNTRKTLSEEDVKKLAERISRIGFEKTRAIWTIKNNDGLYEVFAGGHRLEAAKRTGLKTIPALIYKGLSDEEIRI